MIFNSIYFVCFMVTIFVLYWSVPNKNLRLQNLLILGFNFFFYACWDWRFLFLLILSILLGYCAAIKINSAENKEQKKLWLWLSIFLNLGFLFTFKYFNFFIDSFSNALSYFDFQTNFHSLVIILPVGISFYTFHGLSYIIDVYKGKIDIEKDFINYSVFVSFFPLLVAGPIERATHLLPQIRQKREFSYQKAVDGLRQILWGFFKKIVVADSCAKYSDMIFDNYADYSGPILILGALFFAFQIYCDFSGYTDIALGVARLLGVELLQNFAFPYFSKSVGEFWRRWHISLSSWFRDYVYIPLGGNKGNVWMRIRNIVIVFLLSGLWHGANWTFIVWGLLNALYLIPSAIFFQEKKSDFHFHRNIVMLKDAISILFTFSLITFSWIFFRAQNVKEAFKYVLGIFMNKNGHIAPKFSWIFLLIVSFVFIEWLGKNDKYAIEKIILNWNSKLRWAFYLSLVFAVFLFYGKPQPFIYFQF